MTQTKCHVVAMMLDTRLCVVSFIRVFTALPPLFLHLLQLRKRLLFQAMGVALQLEAQLHQACTDPALSQWLSAHWSDSKGGELGPWERCESPAESWYQVKFSRSGQQSLIQLDVLRGRFLVDGRPLSRLPSEISDSEAYARLFGDMVFDVQPAIGGGFKTAKIGGAWYGFHVSQGRQVIITEERHHKNGAFGKATLVPHQAFESDVPISLLEDYSHWLVHPDEGRGAAVYFRPVRFDHPRFELGCTKGGATYVLDLDSRKIRRTQDQCKLVDVRSESFEALFSILRRLEDRGHVHIFHGDESIATLPRRGAR